MTAAIHSLTRHGMLVCILVSALGAFAKDAPSDWLPTTGKDANWLQRTARIREELANLDTDQPLVKPYVSRIRKRPAGIFPTIANWQYSNTGDWGHTPESTKAGFARLPERVRSQSGNPEVRDRMSDKSERITRVATRTDHE